MCYYTEKNKPKDGMVVAGLVYSMGTFTKKELNDQLRKEGVKVELATSKKVNLVDRVLINLINSGKVTRRGTTYKTIG
ncbi:MAG: hypothetical protein WC154_00265 [Candidatus Izemoplasmatales bacterium]